ncbi:MAG: hypothetical protein FWD05_00735 [Oscillospiraceae bacterium]|nr:hypothetical protein [Oscillospiraceae bacterium]
MVTAILHTSYKKADIEQYTKLLDIDNGDSLVVVSDEDVENRNIIELYNEIMSVSDTGSDILLLSDCVVPHSNLYEQMRICLYVAEKHAIVYGQEIESKESLIKTAERYLPEYSITIQAVPCCVLIKRSVINMLGLFDVSYSSLKYALMDYYCRINIYGFSAIASHRALFSCDGKRVRLGHEIDEKLFISKHPHWGEKEERIAQLGGHPCVEFLKVLDDEYYPKERILFDCIVMPAMHCGTSEYQKSVFEAFNRLYGDKYDIYLCVNRHVAEYHKLTDKYKNIIYPDEMVNEVDKFHLGFAPNQLMHYEHQRIMNKHCLKNVQTMFDVMMVRIDEHVGIDDSGDVELGIRMCDGITFISNFTKNDFLACYSNESSLKGKLLKVIYLATGLDTPLDIEYELPFNDYILIVGNAYKHKAVREAIDAVSNTKYNYIAVGYGDGDYIRPNVYSYESGHLDDDFLSYLYANCKAVIFPSLYEGFGLPLVIGLKNSKRVILNSNELNNELFEYFSEFREHFHFFDKFEQIGEIVNDVDFSKELEKVRYDDTWDRVAAELESFFREILERNVDIEQLYQRWQVYNIIETKIESRTRRAEQLIESQISEIGSLRTEIIRKNAEITHLFKPYELRKLVPLMFFAVKTYAKNRHQWLFKAIKRIAKRKQF